MIFELAIMAIILAFTLYAIFGKRLLISAVCLGLISVLLAIIFFEMGAPYAAGFELIIGSGLISLLFIMAISLSEQSEQNQ